MLKCENCQHDKKYHWGPYLKSRCHLENCECKDFVSGGHNVGIDKQGLIVSPEKL